MDMLNFLDTHFLVSMGFVLVLLTFFYSFIAKRHALALQKVDDALKLQAAANQHLLKIIQALKQTNRLLGELGGMEMVMEDTRELDAPKGHDIGKESSSSIKLYIGNIDYAATESELAEHFSQFGQIEFVNIPVNRYTGKARGFGFVTFSSHNEAERAIALNGSEFKGRQIQVNFAKERGLTS